MRRSLAETNSAYAQLQWACSIIGAILVTINPAYKVHELVNQLLVSRVLILKPGAADRNAEPRRNFALVLGSEHPIVEISEPDGRSMSGDFQFTQGYHSSGSITTPQGGRRCESQHPLQADNLSEYCGCGQHLRRAGLPYRIG